MASRILVGTDITNRPMTSFTAMSTYMTTSHSRTEAGQITPPADPPSGSFLHVSPLHQASPLTVPASGCLVGITVWRMRERPKSCGGRAAQRRRRKTEFRGGVLPCEQGRTTCYALRTIGTSSWLCRAVRIPSAGRFAGMGQWRPLYMGSCRRR